MNCDNQCCENHHHHEYNGGEYGINVNTLVHTNELLLVEQAAELVPVDMRKPGTKITFWTYSGWETWQFISKDVREWPLREAWKQQSVYGMDNIKDLQNQIDSIQIGGWAISQEFGDDEHIGISQKKLTEEFNNVARLDDDGKIPSSQLPSYVDDVLDGYFYNNAFYADENHTQLLDAEKGKIYVDVPTKVSYRYSGSAYVAISNPYYPDEEDLTVDNDIIKFKDKAYSAASYSGLGRKYLRKNMVNGVNTLTQAMFSAANTIYVIQYDYDLNDAEITVPSRCILKFEGGSLSNGSLVFSNTYIDAGYYKIFTNITYSGKVLNPINILWFGAVGDGATNCDDAFAKAFRTEYSNVYENTVYVPHGTYMTSNPIYVRKGCKLIGENATSTNISYSGVGEASRAIVMGENENGADVGGHIPVVSDISILCPNGARGIYVEQSGWKIENTWFTCTVGIEVRGTDGVISKCVSDGGDNFVRLNDTGTPSSIYGNTHSIIISDCITYACNYASIYAKGSYGVIISNCAFYYSKKYGIAVEQECGGFIISNCEFRVSESAGYYDPDNNYHIWTSAGGKLTDSIINGCRFSCSRKGDIYMSAANTTVSNCYFRDSYGFGINLKDNGTNNRILGCMFKSIAGHPVYSFARSIIANNEFNDITHTSETSYLNVCIVNQGAGAAKSFVHDNYNYGDIAVASFINGASNCYSSNNISTGGTFDVVDYTSSLTSYNERKQ